MRTQAVTRLGPLASQETRFPIVSESEAVKSKPAHAAQPSGGAALPAAPQLSGAARRHLRSLAHPLKPVVFVGEGGLSDAVVRAVDAALATHELIKVRLRSPQDKHTAAEQLAEGSHAALCGVVGHTVILYRPNPEEPRIELPRRG